MVELDQREAICLLKEIIQAYENLLPKVEIEAKKIIDATQKIEDAVREWDGSYRHKGNGSGIDNRR